MMDKPIQKVVIVGGGTAGWMSAAALSRVFGSLPGLRIELVESDAIGTIGVGESTIPEINLFNALIGIDEAEFVRETQATYKLGIEFVDWTRQGHRYVHPFGRYGLDMLGIEFHHHWLKGLSLGDRSNLDDYSIGAVAARQGRYLPPRPDQPSSPLSRLSYAFQFDAGLYARYLRGRAERQGVVRTEGRIVQVEQHPETGFVTAVLLENGSRIEGDLFLDCSGFRSLLLGQALGIEFIDWTHWLPCDSAVAMPCAHPAGKEGGADNPITRATARPAGWQWRIPLQHRVGNGYVYSSAHISRDEATDFLLANLDGPPLAEPNHIRFAAGHRARMWEKNVVALGLAGGFLEPLESTAIHLVQSAIARLMTLFPTRGFGEKETERFNRESTLDYVAIRDFLILHYKATERNDTPFWDYCRELTPPDGLMEKIEMFRSSGRVFHDNNELFTEASWLAVMVGQGIKAGGFHPAAHMLSDSDNLTRVAHVREVIANTVSAMPTQAEFLRQSGGAARRDKVEA